MTRPGNLVAALLVSLLVLAIVPSASATGGDAQAFMNSLPSGGHSKTCDKPATARVNSDTGDQAHFTFVNQKYNVKKAKWMTIKGYTQSFTARPNRWVKFADVVFGGCGFGKGRYRLVLKAYAFYVDYSQGFADKHIVGRDQASKTYKVT